jgi:hypothetical protein
MTNENSTSTLRYARNVNYMLKLEGLVQKNLNYSWVWFLILPHPLPVDHPGLFSERILLDWLSSNLP